jgi:hypothetical protein
LAGFVDGGRRQKPGRQRNAVLMATPQRCAALTTLSPVIKACACAAQRCFLRKRASGVPVNALKLRRQSLQR